MGTSSHLHPRVYFSSTSSVVCGLSCILCLLVVDLERSSFYKHSQTGARHVSLPIECITSASIFLWSSSSSSTSAASAMSLWLPRSQQPIVLVFRAVNHRHISPLPLRALSHHVLSRSTSLLIRQPPIPLHLVRYESSNAAVTKNSSQDPKPSPPAPKEDAPLLSRAWKRVKHEAQHYWHGSKLLVSEVRISSRLQWKILHGESLTRRERRQVCSRAFLPFGARLTRPIRI